MVSNDTILAGGDGPVASYEAICKVLHDVRTAIDCGKFYPINRKKNMDTLAELGLTWKDAKEEIRELKECDYHSGPVVDRDYPDSDCLWVFKRRIEGEIIYIKLKIVYQNDGSLKVISFHIDGR